MSNQEFISRRLDLLDKWEERHKRYITRETRERIVVHSDGTAEVEYRPEDEFERMYRLHQQATKLCLLWESRYLESFEDSEFQYLTFDYVQVVIDHRLELRRTLSSRSSKYLPKWARCLIREQVDGIIAALDDIDTLTT
jgi:hypothetical protein